MVPQGSKRNHGPHLQRESFVLGGGQGESSYIQNPEQARTPRAGTTRTRSRVGTATAAPVHRTEHNTALVLLQHYLQWGEQS